MCCSMCTTECGPFASKWSMCEFWRSFCVNKFGFKSYSARNKTIVTYMELRRSLTQLTDVMFMVPCIADENLFNNSPTRCNTKQSTYYSASSLYMFRVLNTTIVRSTQNCNYSLRYCAATSLQRGQASLATLEGGSWTVPEAVVTVLCTPDDGCGWHPKHVKWIKHFIIQLMHNIICRYN